MPLVDAVAAVEVGNCSGHPQDAVVGAGRARSTCSRIAALAVPSAVAANSWYGTLGTSMCRSMRSRRGPLTRPMYFSTCGGVHLHGRLPSPKKPHGHGFIAATRMKLA